MAAQRKYYPDEPAPAYCAEHVPDAYYPEYSNSGELLENTENDLRPVSPPLYTQCGIIDKSTNTAPASLHLVGTLSGYRNYMPCSESALRKTNQASVDARSDAEPQKPPVLLLLPNMQRELEQQEMLRQFIKETTPVVLPYDEARALECWNQSADHLEDMCVILKHHGGQDAMRKVATRAQRLRVLLLKLVSPPRRKEYSYLQSSLFEPAE